MWRAAAHGRGSGTANTCIVFIEACCRNQRPRPLSTLMGSAVAADRPMQAAASPHYHRLLLLQQPPSYYQQQRSRFSTKPVTQEEEQQHQPPNEAGAAVAATEDKPAAAAALSDTKEAEQHSPLFSSPSPRFFRLLAGASLTQIAFWTSYSWLPPELGSNLGYWGIVASGAFCFIARHFAKHYVWEVDAVSPVAFRFSGHTFWGNKGEERIVQVGTTQMQQTTRYIAFKVKGDTWWHLLDIKEGKFKDEDAKEQLARMFMGLRPDGLDQQQGAGESGDEGPTRRRGPAGGRGRKWHGWKAKK